MTDQAIISFALQFTCGIAHKAEQYVDIVSKKLRIKKERAAFTPDKQKTGILNITEKDLNYQNTLVSLMQGFFINSNFRL